MPGLRRDLIYGDNIGLAYGQLDPVEIGMHSHRAHAQIMLLFRPAACDLTWRVKGDKARREHLRGAQLCVVAPKVEHAFRWKEKAGIAKFYVTARFLKNVGNAGTGLGGVAIHDLALVAGHDAIARHLISLFEAFCEPGCAIQDDDFAVAAGRVPTGRLLNFHHKASGPGGRDGQLTALQQKVVNDFLETNLHRGIGVEELMELVFLSKAHFIRLYTRPYGAPPVRSHLFRRLRRAEEMLLRTDCTILDAVHQFGFADQSYFNRAFLKYLKYRPGALLRLRAKAPPK